MKDDICGLCFKLDISYCNFEGFWVFFLKKRIVLKIIFLHGEIYLSFHNSSFALRYFFFFNVDGKATM